MKQPRQVKPVQRYTPPLHALQMGKPASKHTQKPPAHYGPPLGKAARAGQPKRYTPPLGAAARASAKARAKQSKVKKPGKRRGLALAEDVACCAAEALAASLRLTGATVGGGDVLTLYRHTSDGPDAGAAILETLEAAAAFGLAGVYPVAFEPVDLDDPAAQVLGVDLPGAHAVAADSGWWWSWGCRWPLSAWPDAVVEEAWQVDWPCQP